MKKLILICFLFASCTESQKNDDKMPILYDIESMAPIRLYVFDSCEWVGKLRGMDSDVLTHRGRCIFCAQRNAQIANKSADMTDSHIETTRATSDNVGNSNLKLRYLYNTMIGINSSVLVKPVDSMIIQE